MSAGIDAGSGFTGGAVVVALGEEGAEVLGLADPVVPGAAVRLGVGELAPRASVAAPLVQAPSSSPALRAAATAAVGDGIPQSLPGSRKARQARVAAASRTVQACSCGDSSSGGRGADPPGSSGNTDTVLATPTGTLERPRHSASAVSRTSRRAVPRTSSPRRDPGAAASAR